jgi:hypothetical protein
VINEFIGMSKQRDVSPTLIASVYARLGEKTLALRWLEKAKGKDDPPLSDPGFDNLRPDPRFKELEAQLKPTQPCLALASAERR